MEDLRDIVIVVFGIAVSAAALAFLLMAFLLFRKLSSILDMARSTMESIETINQSLLKPTVRALAGVGRFLSWLTGGGDGRGRGETR